MAGCAILGRHEVWLLGLAKVGDFGLPTKDCFLQSQDQMNCILKVYFSLLTVRSPRAIYRSMELGEVKISLLGIGIVDMIAISYLPFICLFKYKL